MLFVYAATDRFLKKGGTLGFLITQELFKSKGAGEGFRRFCLGEKEPFKVFRAYDLATVQPFEGAANKTGAIFLKRGQKTEYPVPYVVWTRKNGVGRIPTDAPYAIAIKMLTKTLQEARPIGSPHSAWQTLSKGSESNVGGVNVYKAHSGAYISPYGVFWLDVKEVLSDKTVLIQNLHERGKTKEISSVETRIEPDLIYPALRGSDIKRWKAAPKISVLLTQDPATSKPIPESVMKSEQPRTYAYLTKFRNILLARKSNVVRTMAEKHGFYAVFGVGEYTVASYKVIWKRMSNDLCAVVISQWKTKLGYKPIIPLETTALIALSHENEAHYICAILNSQSVRDFIKSYSSAGRGFGTPSVMQHVGIPKYDPKNELHVKLSKLSQELHELVLAGDKQAEVEKKENEVGALVAKLFS